MTDGVETCESPLFFNCRTGSIIYGNDLSQNFAVKSRQE
jgi:hypothetical protein